MEKMKKLQKRCEPFELMKAGRHLLREGEMMNVTNWEVPQPYHAILVTDSFFLAGHKVIRRSEMFSNSISRTLLGAWRSGTALN